MIFLESLTNTIEIGIQQEKEKKLSWQEQCFLAAIMDLNTLLAKQPALFDQAVLAIHKLSIKVIAEGN